MLLQRWFFSGLSFKQIKSGQESKIQRREGNLTMLIWPETGKVCVAFQTSWDTLFMLPPFAAAVSAEKCTSNVKLIPADYQVQD